MTNTTMESSRTSGRLLISRRRLITTAAAGLAIPAVMPKHAWAQNKTLQILTYTGPQGQYVREKVIPQF